MKLLIAVLATIYLFSCDQQKNKKSGLVDQQFKLKKDIDSLERKYTEWKKFLGDENLRLQKAQLAIDRLNDSILYKSFITNSALKTKIERELDSLVNIYDSLEFELKKY